MKVTLSSLVKHQSETFQITLLLETDEELRRLKDWLKMKNLSLVLLIDYFEGKSDTFEAEKVIRSAFTVVRR